MTVQEFSNEFDVLVSSYRRFKDFDNKEELDSIEFSEYEKSVFLTKAQEELVLSLYNGKNSFGESFEQTEELRRYLGNLVAEASITPIQSSNGNYLGVDSKSKFFTLPSNLWFITYEAVTTSDSACGKEGTMDVYPVTQDEYHKTKRNPFRGANGRRALRLDLSEGVIEIVCKYNVTKYYVRYLKKLEPIVLVDMPNDISVGGVSNANPCKVHSGLHQRILELAVRMALESKGIGVRTNNREQNNN